MINKQDRATYDLKKGILTFQARDWSDPVKVVEEYFKQLTDDDVIAPNGVPLINELISSLSRLSSQQQSSKGEEKVNTLLAAYCTNLQAFYQHCTIKSELFESYQAKEINARLQRQQRRTQAQISTTTLTMIEEEGSLVERTSKKRRTIADDDTEVDLVGEGVSRESALAAASEDDVDIDFIAKLNESYDSSSFTENPFAPDSELQTSQYTIIRGQKRFDYHTPGRNDYSPGKPKLDSVGNKDLSKLFDIRLSNTPNPNCFDETEEIYKQYQADQATNKYIKQVDGAVELNTKALFDKNVFLSTRALWKIDCPESKFNDFILITFSDYYQNCQRSKAYDYSDERTFFCEVIIPMYKNFNVMMGGMCGTWCEKQLQDSKTMWVPLKDYRATGVNRKLLDGIIVNTGETSAILIESSGSEENFEHSIDDTYKQMKGSSDFLKALMCKHKLATVNTAKKICVPTASIIGNRMTLCLTSIMTKHKWRYVEARSCRVPTITAEKAQWIKVFEFFAFLEHIVSTNIRIVDEMELESNRYVEVDNEAIKIKDFF
jgi:hypothetical protein